MKAMIQPSQDSGEYAFDSECDDPRFGASIRSNLLRDATDCRTSGVVSSGNKEFVGVVFDFGSDASEVANNSFCEDTRFVGARPQGDDPDEFRRRDASDCIAAYREGSVDFTSFE